MKYALKALAEAGRFSAGEIQRLNAMLRENVDLKKHADGLEMNLAAVIQRAEAAEARLGAIQAANAETRRYAKLRGWAEGVGKCPNCDGTGRAQ